MLVAIKRRNFYDFRCRKPEIMADSAYILLMKNSKKYTGNFAIDEDILKVSGITKFDQYAYDPSKFKTNF